MFTRQFRVAPKIPAWRHAAAAGGLPFWFYWFGIGDSLSKKAFDKMDQSRSLVDVAKQAVVLREEGDRLAGVQLGYGVMVQSKKSEAVAALAKARADRLKAELGYAESQAELEALIGRLPR